MDRNAATLVETPAHVRAGNLAVVAARIAAAVAAAQAEIDAAVAASCLDPEMRAMALARLAGAPGAMLDDSLAQMWAEIDEAIELGEELA